MSKYPKRGGDCEYTEDCMWGVDGWCDRPSDYKCVLQQMDTKAKAKTKASAVVEKAQPMKKVYICSRYRADKTHTIEEAVDSALLACSIAISRGYAPYAPHLYLPRCLDDNDPEERAQGMEAGSAFLAACDEVWQWGKTITEGMAAELALAEKLGIPIKVYNTIGIPQEKWNSVKFADDPDYIADCKKAGRLL